MSAVTCALSPAACLAQSTASSATHAVFSAIVNWVGESTAFVYSSLGSALATQGTDADILQMAAVTYHRLLLIAPLVTLIALISTSLWSLRHGDPATLVREVGLTALIVIIGIAGAPTIARIVLSSADALSSAAAPDVARTVSGIARRGATIPGTSPLFASLLMDLAAVVGALALWFELLVRAALLSLLLAMSPLVVAASVFVPIRRVGLRLFETFCALALAKVVVVIALSVGASALVKGTISEALVGAVATVLAALTPFAILRVVPLFESSALHATAGIRQQFTSGAQRQAVRVAGAVSGVMPVAMPSPPERSEDLGIDMWPSSPPPDLPEQPDTRPDPPVGKPRLRGGHAVPSRDHMGPVIGWHFDE